MISWTVTFWVIKHGSPFVVRYTIGADSATEALEVCEGQLELTYGVCLVVSVKIGAAVCE